MKPLLIVALLSSVILVHDDLQAQGRGGFRGGAAGGASAAGARGGGGFNTGTRGAVVAPGPASHAGRSIAGIRPHTPVVAPRVFGRPAFVSGVTPFYDPFYDPFLFSSPYYPAPYSATPYAPETPGVQQDYQQDNQFNELTYEVERLSEEVRRLREEQAVRVFSQAPPPAVENQRPATPTTLVFRDGRQVEAQGYAIVGQSIWILTETSSSRVSLADLDVAATQRVNAERGIRFLVPRG